jgi:hypothetical protein
MTWDEMLLEQRKEAEKLMQFRQARLNSAPKK